MINKKIDLRKIPINKIVPNPKNPRLLINSEEFDKLVESVKERGILVPLSVFINPKKKFVIIDGERRYKAASRLGIRELPVVLRSHPKEINYITDMFHIHNMREPWELVPTAIKLKELEEDFHKKGGKKPSEKKLHSTTGLTISTIRRCRIISDMPIKVQNLILEEGSKTSKEKKIIGKDKLLTADFFIEVFNNIIRPLKENNEKIFKELGGEKEIFNSMINKRGLGKIKNIVSLRPFKKHIKKNPRKGGGFIKEFLLNEKISAEDILEKSGLDFNPFKFERNFNVFRGALSNIPRDLNEKSKKQVSSALRKMKKLIDTKLNELGSNGDTRSKI